MKHIHLMICAIFIATATHGQMKINTQARSAFSNSENLPLWMTSNQSGVYPIEGDHAQLANLSYTHNLELTNNKWVLNYGADLWYSYNGDSDFHINQLYTNIGYQWMNIRIGAKQNDINFNGLSSTNQDINWSNNARPLAGALLATKGFVPFKKDGKFSFYAEYGESLLGDDRVVVDAYLHQKKLHFKYTTEGSWTYEIGLDHYAQWGGTTEKGEKLPCSFEEYYRTVLGMSGGDKSLETDQINVAGNSFGSYIINVTKETKNSTYKLLYNHIFRDASGMEYNNWQDGFYAFAYENKKEFPIVKRATYEFTYSMDQSGDTHLKYDPELDRSTGRGQDDYYNHGIYKSGWTYKNYAVGSPFWVPTIDENGISRGFNSTRLIAHFIGAEGFVSPEWTWRSVVSYCKNYGSYMRKTEFDMHQTSFAISCGYHPNNSPWKFSAMIAHDNGNEIENCTAFQFGIKYMILGE